MIKVVLFGVSVHVIFLVSVFRVYFQSPIIENLAAQPQLTESPAKRLVLFVADGLRAESFLRDSLELTPFLRDVILDKGIFGISRTHVPTESRPGHVALIAGFYEDPSAVLEGWQHNPVDFDSVFNRSRTTYAWGSPDILSIFTNPSTKNFVATAYAHESEDFSGKSDTSSLDVWVFEKVVEFLHRNGKAIASNDRMVFFLHLLGLDTAGHVHKPNSDLFVDNLREVDKGIAKVTDLFNRIFPDGQTAFIFTADHGMTNKGAHGDGSDAETETPIIAWGSGVSYWKATNTTSTQPYLELDDVKVPRFDIEQADIAPLMSSLIGSTIPTNNRGRLPLSYLDAAAEYKCRSVMHNKAQITTIFKHLQDHYKKSFLFKDFEELNEIGLLSLEYHIQTAFKAKDYDEATAYSYYLIDRSLKGIEYFQAYHQNLLLFTVTAAMIGWMILLGQQLGIDNDLVTVATGRSITHSIAWGLLVVAFSLFAYVQQMALADGALVVLPLLCWYPVRTYNMLRHLSKLETWIWIAGVELLVISFFYRICLSGILLALVAYEYTILRDKKEKLSPFFNWALNCAILAIYPALPIVDKDSSNIMLLLIGLGAWTLKVFFAAVRDSNPFKLANFVVFSVGAVNLVWIIWDLHEKRGLSEFKQIISWILLITSFILPTISSNSLRDRLSAIISSLALPYIFLSLSYEPLFFMTFSSCVYYWVSMIYTEKKQMFTHQIDQTDADRSAEPVDFKRAFICILYVLVSFFGTGNIASVSSFDTNWVRCFISTFAPFLMSSLIILKLLIPILLVMCAVRQIHSITKIPLDKFFIIILLCCDIMCLNFLYLIKNTGSWLQIGTSISHFVIMEATVVVLCLIQLIAKFLTSYQLQSFLSLGRTRDLSANTVKIE